MKKLILFASIILLIHANPTLAQLNMQQLDSSIRAAQPNNNSIMFRRNAQDYRNMTEAQKAEIEKHREEMRKQAEEYARQKAEYERYQAQRRAEEEAARKRAEELKPITLYGNKLKIYALVNGEPITSTDMQSRINAFILTTGIPYNDKTKKMITNRVLQGAIDEKLKIQEAKKNNIIVPQKEINQAVHNFEQANGMQPGQLRKVLAEGNVQMNIWTGQIESDLAWRKLVTQKAHSYINVGENDIQRAYDEMRKDMKTQKFMVSEIVVNKKDARDLTPLVEVLRQDPRFELYAMQFSQSPSASNGGHLGWVLKGRLPATLENAVLKLKEGDVTNPILYGNDYYILKLEKIFNPKTDIDSLPSKKQVRNYLENKKLEEFAIKYMKDLRNKALIEKRI